ncbi:hypothetical protein J6590_088135 [Homalodisca vitripennis]|nr:hypothetical protein J6590_088135 [Homalodisca vitripennis]
MFKIQNLVADTALQVALKQLSDTSYNSDCVNSCPHFDKQFLLTSTKLAQLLGWQCTRNLGSKFDVLDHSAIDRRRLFISINGSDISKTGFLITVT